MKSMLSLTAVALLCASASFAGNPTYTAPAHEEVQPAEDDRAALFVGSGLSPIAIAGAAVVLIALIASSSDSTTSTNGTN
jgi:hypothetical protein